MEVSSVQEGITKICPRKIRMAEVAAFKVFFPQICSPKIGPTEIFAAGMVKAVGGVVVVRRGFGGIGGAGWGRWRIVLALITAIGVGIGGVTVGLVGALTALMGLTLVGLVRGLMGALTIVLARGGTALLVVAGPLLIGVRT